MFFLHKPVFYQHPAQTKAPNLPAAGGTGERLIPHTGSSGSAWHAWSNRSYLNRKHCLAIQRRYLRSRIRFFWGFMERWQLLWGFKKLNQFSGSLGSDFLIKHSIKFDQRKANAHQSDGLLSCSPIMGPWELTHTDMRTQTQPSDWGEVGDRGAAECWVVHPHRPALGCSTEIQGCPFTYPTPGISWIH